MSDVKTYWNGLPTSATRGTAVVARKQPWPKFWGSSLVGQRIEVVRVVHDMVIFDGKIDYLDDRYGEAWDKVTEAFGSPTYPHRSLLVDEGTFEIKKES